MSDKLRATGADADARAKATLSVQRRGTELRGQLVVSARKLDAGASFEVAIDGVRIGTLESNPRGKGKARFRTAPRRPTDQLLGVDPRGRALSIVREGAVVLTGMLSRDSIDGADIRCCLPHDSGAECEDRTPAECAAQGGVDLGPGSCMPNPCAGAPGGTEVVCCFPDDSGPECEDRTAAQCAAGSGVNLGPGTCTPNPCAPLPAPDGDIRCCLPDDSGTECEDRTAAECATGVGVNIGPGACAPNPCLGGGTTSTTLPRTPVLRVSCEKRADRSRASVDGQNLAAGSYRARLTSGVSIATSTVRPTVGDEVEFDFDSQPDDIAAGATPIAPNFITGTPPAVTGELLDGAGAVVTSAAAVCALQ